MRRAAAARPLSARPWPRGLYPARRAPLRPAAFPSLLTDPATAATLASLASAGAVVAAGSRLVTAAPTTPSVLAAVSFKTLVPALQFVSVGTTLARAGLGSSGGGGSPALGGLGLLALPAAAALFVGVGVVAGAAAGAAAGRAREARGTPEVVAALSACGNAVTIPTCLLAALLPAGSAEADAAAAYVALYAAGWSPLLWTVGAGLVARAAAAAGGNAPGGRQAGAPSLAAAIWRSARSSPPLAATLAAVALGASPLGPALFLGPAELAAAAGTPATLTRLAAWPVAAARALLVGPARLLAAGALPGQLLVLGASLAPPVGQKKPTTARPGPLPTLLGPEPAALAAVAAVRMLVLPAVGLAAVGAARAAGWGVGLDPVAALVLCIQAAVPPAQTVVVMALAAGDRGGSDGVSGDGGGLAARLAGLVVRLYAWSALPMCVAAIGSARWVGVRLA